jgi:hypothetical protein
MVRSFSFMNWDGPNGRIETSMETQGGNWYKQKIGGEIEKPSKPVGIREQVITYKVFENMITMIFLSIFYLNF